MKTSLFVLLMLVTSTCATADKFVVGVEDIAYYPLFDYKNKKTSYSKEMLEEFGRQYGHQFSFLPLPIKRFSRWLVDEQIDFKYPDNVRWEDGSVDTSKFVYSDATIQLVAGTHTLKDSQVNPENFKVLGTLLGFYPTQWIDQIQQNKVKLYEHPSTMILIQQMLRGDIDGIDIEPSVVNHHLDKLGKRGLIQIDKRFTFEVYAYYLSTIKHGPVIIQFNQFLKDNNVWLEQLRKKFKIVDHRPYIKQKSPEYPGL